MSRTLRLMPTGILLATALIGGRLAAQLSAPDYSAPEAAQLPDAPSSVERPELLVGGTLLAGTPSQQYQVPASVPGKPAQRDEQGAQTAQQTQNETEAQRRKREAEESDAILRKEEQQRLLGVVPNFTVVYEGQTVPPLTPRQKFSLVMHTSIDPFTIGYAFVSAGYSEIRDTHTGFGWGPGGYFKRFGSGYADTVDGALIGNAVLPILFHQDPRYFRMGHGPFKQRFLHAALATVECHGDNGRNQINYSNVLGNYLAGAISNAYYPTNERGVGLTLENGTEVTLYGAVGGQILEFAPDAISYLKRHHHHKAP